MQVVSIPVYWVHGPLVCLQKDSHCSILHHWTHNPGVRCFATVVIDVNSSVQLISVLHGVGGSFWDELNCHHLKCIGVWCHGPAKLRPCFCRQHHVTESHWNTSESPISCFPSLTQLEPKRNQQDCIAIDTYGYWSRETVNNWSLIDISELLKFPYFSSALSSPALGTVVESLSFLSSPPMRSVRLTFRFVQNTHSDITDILEHNDLMASKLFSQQQHVH